ncbi:diguanylate cyclase [Erythrobacter sp. MTPC3]|uniref:GGDEF domain-containing protein n=1 Tax=Erythrobacter sp. MTPC3 TaxID=3056564 RepID=UPI0036F3D4B5
MDAEALDRLTDVKCSKLSGEPEGGDWTTRLTVDADAKPPNILYTRLGYFDRLEIAARDVSGNWTKRSYTIGEVETAIGEPFIYAKLPQTELPTQMVVAEFVGNGHGPTLVKAELRSELPALTNDDVIHLMIVAALVGVLLIPIALDAAILLVMRQSFLAWHIVLSVSFAFHIAGRANLLGLGFPVSADLWRWVLIMSMGCVVAAALMFTRSFIEPGKLPAWLQRAMPVVAIWTIGISAVHAASFEVLRPLGGSLHSFGMLVPLVILILSLAIAWRRGSRAVWFPMLGWAPIFISSAIQFATHAIGIGVQQDANSIFMLGVMCEAIATALGVADRFTTLRRERDKARRDAVVLSRLSERDPLTGLINRRAVTMRFADLRAEGFDTFALIDLDRFKAINDRYGHQVGDATLVVCAEALSSNPDRDAVAVRLGGEEFVVLLRGRDAIKRAEALRQSIPIHVAHNVAGLEWPVTASMGVIELPQASKAGISFEEMYARADQLLYDAKKSGRNRMAYERLKMFNEAPPPRSAATASTAEKAA